MGLFSGLLGAAVPAVASFFGGPVGGLVGSLFGSQMGEGDSYSLSQNDGSSSGGGFDWSGLGRSIGGFADSAIGGVANSAGSLAGSYMALQGARETNQMNRDMLGSAQGFNAAEAEKSRTFQADQGEVSRRFGEGQAITGMNFNAAMAKQQMDFQERMSNTAWQRAVGDMSAAGLNPMLAYSQGGSSSPAGSVGGGGMAGQSHGVGSAEAASPGLPHLENAMSTAINTGLSIARQGAEIDKIKAETGKVGAETDTIRFTLKEILPEEKVKVVNAAIVSGLERARHEHFYGAQTGQGAFPYFKAQVERSIAEAGLTEAERQRVTAILPRLFNEANAQSSWWMRNVSPYLPDFLKGATGAGAVSRMLP